MRKLDAIDRNLLALLQDDARLATSELARRVGTARTTVSERVARLEREGRILGYTAVVVEEAQVLETRAVLNLGCNRAACRSIVAALKSYPEIEECLSVTGSYDLMCMVRTPHQEDLDALVDEIAMLPGVNAVDATIALASKFRRRAHVPTAPRLQIAS
ncbi:Lrp/AsnC family transcriptional regulator [Ruegeria sp. EL01]|jgi:DNA-binding Lrp family transcriptional regulator|uniref:Lrp/AsnC family transcriptional regulator n=1 Tax=Ruegeria sp. EL01 TaxID=2107578 RepID=UPI000EA810AA|nr:Lrp/AsnC family transcriptional regulator [Ruegeria sp. EL01]